MGSRASDSQNWYLISGFSKPFSQYFIVTSSLPQLTNLFCTHIAHHRKTVLPTALGFYSVSCFLSSSWLVDFVLMSLVQMISLISVHIFLSHFIFITLEKLPCNVERLFHLPDPLFSHLLNRKIILNNWSASILFFFFFFFFFLYGCAVFFATCRLSPLVVSGVYSLVAVHRLLMAVASPVAEHRLFGLWASVIVHQRL